MIVIKSCTEDKGPGMTLFEDLPLVLQNTLRKLGPGM